MRALAAALVLLAAGAGAPQATLAAARSGEPAPDVTAAWRGWARPGSWSEIVVRLPPAAQGGRLDLTAGPPGARQVTAAIVLREGAPAAIRMGVPVAERLTLNAAAPDGSTRSGRFTFRLAERPLLAWAVAAALPEDRARETATHLLAVSGADLPHVAASYSAIGGIAIDAATLGSLEPTQLAALLEHVSGCGFTILVGVEEDVRSVFEHAAGCGGKSLLLAAAPLEPHVALDDFAGRQAAEALEPAGLALAGAEDGQPRWLAVALLAYLALAAIVIIAGRRPSLAIVLPAVATGVIGLALWIRAPRESLAIWAEASEGDAVARYAAWLRVQGTAPGRHRVELPPLLSQATGCEPESSTQFVWDEARARIGQAVVATRLLSSERLCFAGSFPIAASYHVALAAPSILELRADGAARPRPAWLLWEGRAHELVLGGGTRAVRIHRERGSAPATPAQQLAAGRLAWNEAGLLLPLEVPLETPTPPTAWLLVRLPLEERTAT